MDVLALLFLIVAACLLMLVAPVLRVRESSHRAAHRSLMIQSLPSVLAVLWWKLAVSGAPPSMPPAMPDMGIAPALAFGLQLLATPLALRHATVTPGARGVYTVLSAIAAMSMVVLYAAVQTFLPPSGDRSKYAAHDRIRSACLSLNSGRFQGPRADLEKYCDCAGRRVVAEVGLDALRKAQASGADAVDQAQVAVAFLSAQSSCAQEQFGQKQ